MYSTSIYLTILTHATCASSTASGSVVTDSLEVFAVGDAAYMLGVPNDILSASPSLDSEALSSSAGLYADSAGLYGRFWRSFCRA